MLPWDMPVSFQFSIDDDLANRLKERASQHGRSLEAEHRAILLAALDSGETFEALSAQLRALTAGRQSTASEVLLRQSRAER